MNAAKAPNCNAMCDRPPPGERVLATQIAAAYPTKCVPTLSTLRLAAPGEAGMRRIQVDARPMYALTLRRLRSGVRRFGCRCIEETGHGIDDGMDAVRAPGKQQGRQKYIDGEKEAALIRCQSY